MVKHKSGISLIEIIFAVGILAFAMIPIAGIMGQGIKGTQKNYRDISAVQLLERVLNQAISAKYSDIPAGTYISDITLSSGKTIHLGDVDSSGNTYNNQGNKYNVVLAVSNKNVTFKYKPINVSDPGFVPGDESTWKFDAEKNLNFDGSTAANAQRVKEIVATVLWNEPNGIAKTYCLKSFLTKLKD